MSRNTTYSGWGRALTATGPVSRADDLRLIGTAAPAIGNRRSYGDAPLNSQGAVTDMTRLDRILGFDPETGYLDAEAGVTLGDLTRLFAPRGWLPAVLPGTGFATIGGAIAMDVHGKNHHVAGSFCQHVRAITLRQSTGDREITPKDDALWRATCGGLGQTGVILRATLQLKPVPGPLMLVTEQRATDWDHHIALLNESEAPYCVGWIDATARGAALGRGIVEEGTLCKGLCPPPRKKRAVPMTAPHWALSAPVVKSFNHLYYNRVPSTGRTVTRRVDDFFFPLDKIEDWNKLYGRRGFHQFQCVLPSEATPALRDMMDQIGRSGLASPLAVLKRMGPGRAGDLSFPMEGFTLAVDFPNRVAARALITNLERATLAAGGRIYLAKDALSAPHTIKSMYPDHANWAKIALTADPEHALVTDLVRRLDLRPSKDTT